MHDKIELELRQFITQNFLFGRENLLGNDESFLESGILDSTGVLELISFLEEKYGIELQSNELVPENLDSISRVVLFLQTKLNHRQAGACSSDADQDTRAALDRKMMENIPL